MLTEPSADPIARWQPCFVWWPVEAIEGDILFFNRAWRRRRGSKWEYTRFRPAAEVAAENDDIRTW